MGCASCGKRYAGASKAARQRLVPTRKSSAKVNVKVKEAFQQEAPTRVEDKSVPRDPSTGQPISVVKQGTQPPPLPPDQTREPVSFEKPPKSEG